MLLQLSTEHAQLNFRHVQPTAVLGCKMELQLFEDSTSFCGWKGFIQRSWIVRVKVVHNHPDQDRIGIENIYQPFHSLGKIYHRMALRNPDIPFPGQGFIKIQGHGTLGVRPIETPTMIRFGQLSNDEYIVSCGAAQAGVKIINPSETDPIVMLKHFGPNPDAPKARQ